MIAKALQPVAKLIAWFTSKQNRLRLAGARIEVMAFIITREPIPSILLARSAYHDIWMPPQEGVNFKESFETALYRCMNTECGIKIPTNKEKLGQLFHIRSYSFIGVINLHPSRHGEREISQNIQGTIFEGIRLKKKAYWMAPVLLDNQDAIKFKPDGKEILELKWCSFNEAKKLIKDSNHDSKAELLLKSLDACEKHVTGGLSPAETRAERA